MPIRKTGSGDFRSWEIDSSTSLEMVMEGVMGCLEGESIAGTSDEPETIIVIRSDGVNRTMEVHDRGFRATVYNGATIPQIIEDLQKQLP